MMVNVPVGTCRANPVSFSLFFCFVTIFVFIYFNQYVNLVLFCYYLYDYVFISKMFSIHMSN